MSSKTPYAEKQAVVQQYRKVRGYKNTNSGFDEDVKVKSIRAQIKSLEKQLSEVRESNYAEDKEYSQETETKILDYMNGKIKVLE